MDPSYEVIVAGLGAMGSASVHHLARRGVRVLGLDRFAPGHTQGSSHGDSRIIRELYFEHPLYVPLVQRAYRLWDELQQASRRPLMELNGGLMIGPPGGMLVEGTLRSAREHGLPCELLDPSELARRFPAFRIPAEWVAVWDPRAGYLRPEACIQAQLREAEASGARLRYHEPALHWEPDGDGVRVHTATAVYRADRLLLSSGAWVPHLLRGLELPLEIERQVVYWFDPPAADGRHQPDACPIYAWEHTPGYIGYGFPRLERGMKAALMHQGERSADPESVRRGVDAGEDRPLRAALAPVLPGVAAAPLLGSAVCLFTNTPDGNFAIGFHSHHPQVLVSSPCSGHGFKFASAIGELHADLLTGTPSAFDLTPFRLDRFAKRPEARS